MPEQRDFKQLQYAFTAHVRNPRANPRPADVEARRMKIYNELLYNNVEGFIANSFPVLRQIISDDKWHAMVRDYFEHHRATTPLFPEMPREFLRYLEHEREAAADDLPFMLELAHYEWVELALSISDQDPAQVPVDADTDLLEGRPVLSPLAWPLSYQYPVHQIGPDFLPEAPGDHPSFLIVYRDREDEVRFLEINPVTAQLLQWIQQDHAATAREMLSAIAEQLGYADPAPVLQGGRQILEDLHQRGVILGVNPN